MISQSDTPKLTFEAEVKPVKYGDKRTFFEYRIVMSSKYGRVLGTESGPSRTTEDRRSATKAARSHIELLRSHHLFAIRVTAKHIDDGEARSCSTCAISQALWHNQERMGFSKYDYQFEVSPYGAWIDPRGIVLSRKYRCSGQAIHIPATELPDISVGGKYRDSMFEWAMRWDEWAESRYMGLKEWRDLHSYQPDEWPYRPRPCSFVLDMDAFKPLPENLQS